MTLSVDERKLVNAFHDIMFSRNIAQWLHGLSNDDILDIIYRDPHLERRLRALIKTDEVERAWRWYEGMSHDMYSVY